MSVPRSAAVQAEGLIGPTIGRSGYRTAEAFGDAILPQYQKFFDHGFGVAKARAAAGRIPNNPMSIGAHADQYARLQLRRWLLNSEGIQEGPGRIIQVNRWLRDPTGSGVRVVPDVRIPAARLSFDATTGFKFADTLQIQRFRVFSGGDNVVIVRPTELGGSYGVFFP